MLRSAALAAAVATLAAPAVASDSPQPFTYPFTACEVPGASRSLAAGETTYVCLNINGVVTSIYNVVVDSFHAVALQGSNYAMPTGAGFMQEGVGWVSNITVPFNTTQNTVFYSVFDLASHNIFSLYPRVYKKITYSPVEQGSASADISTIPVWTAIIKMDNGVVTDIGWDDGCFFCAENGADCVNNAVDVNGTAEIVSDALRSCREPSATCYPPTQPLPNGTASGSVAQQNLTDTGCDLKVFLTWTGTDRKGQFLRSAGKRFSRFRQFGIATMYQSAINLANDGLNIANSAIAAVQSVPGRIIPSMNSDLRRLEEEEGATGDAMAAVFEPAPAGDAGSAPDASTSGGGLRGQPAHA